MKILYILALLSLPVFSQNGFRPLFDGKTLDGWEGDSRLWSVRDGAIVGSTEKAMPTHNTFLIYRKAQFGNFELHAEVKLGITTRVFSSAVKRSTTSSFAGTRPIWRRGTGGARSTTRRARAG